MIIGGCCAESSGDPMIMTLLAPADIFPALLAVAPPPAKPSSVVPRCFDAALVCDSESGGRRTPPTKRCGAEVGPDADDDDAVAIRGDALPSLTTSGDESESLEPLEEEDDESDGTMAERAFPDDDCEMARGGDREKLRNCAKYNLRTRRGDDHGLREMPIISSRGLIH